MIMERKARFVRSLLFISVFVTLALIHRLSFAFRDLGVPIRDAILWGAYVGPGKTGALDTIYLSFGQYSAPLFLLAVNPETGDTRQFNGPLSSEMGSWGYTTDHENRITSAATITATSCVLTRRRRNGRISDSLEERKSLSSAGSPRHRTERYGEGPSLPQPFFLTTRRQG